jgi:hypothetical protein
MNILPWALKIVFRICTGWWAEVFLKLVCRDLPNWALWGGAVVVIFAASLAHRRTNTTVARNRPEPTDERVREQAGVGIRSASSEAPKVAITIDANEIRVTYGNDVSIAVNPHDLDGGEK